MQGIAWLKYLVSRIRHRARYMLNNHIHQTRRRPKELIQHHLQQRPSVHLVHDRLQMDAQSLERRLQLLALLREHAVVQLVEGLENEVHERALLVGVGLLLREFALLLAEVDVAPEAIGESVDVEFSYTAE